MRPCDVRVRLRQQFRLRPADWQVWAPSLVLLLRLQMTNAIFEFSVPVFERHLKILAKLLETAEPHAKDRKIEAAALNFARLFPDMFSLADQALTPPDTAKLSNPRLIRLEGPQSQDTDKSH